MNKVSKYTVNVTVASALQQVQKKKKTSTYNHSKDKSELFIRYEYIIINSVEVWSTYKKGQLD